MVVACFSVRNTIKETRLCNRRMKSILNSSTTRTLIAEAKIVRKNQKTQTELFKYRIKSVEKCRNEKFSRKYQQC